MLSICNKSKNRLLDPGQAIGRSETPIHAAVQTRPENAVPNTSSHT